MKARGLHLGAVIGLASLGLSVIATATAVVYVKYQTRIEFVDLQAVRAARDALDVEWGRLRIEEAAMGTQTRVERRARQSLKMHLPRTGELRIVEVKTE
ncbi:MAG: cell division protein FtsL [Lamprobacter sp.]|uniref:cell division protein FtsL n=1 Tax=Lamprobacter sp. TaxID=3100796 RepID=UPI002B260B6B|nr:cell division protein FtsL [Lamprobacter sp.]MEA3640207.1 cell division protein FtsL [Lamprobacter sp.]